VSYAKPSILRTAPLSTEGGEVVIMGENLGSADNAASGALEVTFDGIPATSLEVTQDHKKLRCCAPPGVGTARILVTLGTLASGDYEALFAPPLVTALDPPDMDPAGGWMTIHGANFGASADRVQVLLPEVQGAVASLDLVEAHRTLKVLIPPIPSGWEQGLPLRMRIVVAGVFAAEQVDLVYSPPGGVAARAGRPAYITRRRLVGGEGARAGETPLTHIFASSLSAEAAKKVGGSSSSGRGGASSSSPASSSSATAASTAAAAATAAGKGASPLVKGSLLGEGPTLTVTNQSKWQPDTPSCTLCTREFGVLALRRHHCRVCGACVCGSCSPFELRLDASKPPVRICSRCNLRVGLLTQMTACLDAIEGIKRLCGVDTEIYQFFRTEVTTCVSTPLAAKGGGGAAAAAAAASPGGGGGGGGAGGAGGAAARGGGGGGRSAGSGRKAGSAMGSPVAAAPPPRALAAATSPVQDSAQALSASLAATEDSAQKAYE